MDNNLDLSQSQLDETGLVTVSTTSDMISTIFSRLGKMSRIRRKDDKLAIDKLQVTNRATSKIECSPHNL